MSQNCYQWQCASTWTTLSHTGDLLQTLSPPHAEQWIFQPITHEYIHHTKWNHTLANDYSTLSQSVLSLSIKMSMPPPAYIGMRWHQQNTMELTTQTKTQQLPEEYVKVVHSAVLTSILLISTIHCRTRPWSTVRRRCLHTPQCWNFRICAHLFTDLASRQVYPVFTKSKLVMELIARMACRRWCLNTL